MDTNNYEVRIELKGEILTKYKISAVNPSAAIKLASELFYQKYSELKKSIFPLGISDRFRDVSYHVSSLPKLKKPEEANVKI